MTMAHLRPKAVVGCLRLLLLILQIFEVEAHMFRATTAFYHGTAPIAQQLTKARKRTVIRQLSWHGTVFTAAKRDGEDEDAAAVPKPGMAEAFRQLESLNSLDDPEEYVPAPDKIELDASTTWDRDSLLVPSNDPNEIAPERDFALYKNMMEELEEDEVASAYTDVLDELGSSSLQTNDTYSQVLFDMGGTRLSFAPQFFSCCSCHPSSSPAKF